MKLDATKTLPVVLAAMMAPTQARAAKDVDLSEFDGNYKGKGTITALGQTYSMTANVKFDVSKNGSTAEATLSGSIAFEDGLPWGTTLKLKKKGKLTSSNLLTINEGMIYPGSGKYKVAKNGKLEAKAQTIVGSTQLVQEVTVEVKPKGRKKDLKVKIRVLANGEDYFQINLTVKGK